jgi:ATP-dependent helicase/nuclease subunit A
MTAASGEPTSREPAYAIDAAPVRRQAFYAAACDPSRSVIVEACAGAGKTWMLVSRILRALLAGAQPHEILAITFTRKAAGEMRARLDEWLAEFGAPGCSDEQRAQALRERGMGAAEARAAAPALASLHDTLLRQGRSVEVRTFHAWFSQLLRAAPLELLAELGLQPDMELLEDVDDHRADVYRRFHAAVIADAALRDDYATLVRERGRSQLRKWLDAAWHKRIEIELADRAGTLVDSVPSAAAHWAHLAGLDHPSRHIESPRAHALLAAVASALGTHKGAVCRKQGALLEQALALLEPMPRLAAARAALFTKDGGLRKGLDAAGVDEAAALLDEIEQACAQQSAHEDHQRMVRLSRALFSEYAAYKRAKGLADMADLERCALALLRDATLAGWVQERLDARVRHLLIDEFQDTSPLQWHALHAWLSAYAGAGGGASGQRPPGVFIVGDPKQSIYRFRGAEPRVFAAARDFVVDGLGGSILACDHTRRNAPELLQALNGVFGQAQAHGEYAGFRPHTTELGAQADAGLFALPGVMRPDKPVAGSADADRWRDSLTTARQEPEELLRAQEAEHVAIEVERLLRHGKLAAREIQVLCRKRESLRLVAAAFAARHLPFAAAEDFPLLDAPEARDLLAVLDVLASPSHKLSLAQALRSPIFGAADDDLVTLALASTAHGDWWRALRELASPSPALQRARALLQRWHSAAQRLPPHDLLDIVVDEGEVRQRVAATVPAAQRTAALGAVDAVLHQALTLDGARYATPYNFVRALKRRSIKVPAALQSEAVQLLTVHGAKGLEATLVFVMDADPTPKNPETATLLVDWPVDSEHPLHCAFVYAESQCPPSLAGVLAREIEARQREELNGLYVAMTRAKRRLVFSATQPHRPSPGRLPLPRPSSCGCCRRGRRRPRSPRRRSAARQTTTPPAASARRSTGCSSGRAGRRPVRPSTWPGSLARRRASSSSMSARSARWRDASGTARPVRASSAVRACSGRATRCR